MASVDLDRVDGFDVLTRLTKRTMHFAYVVFLMREQGQATLSADVAGKFQDCSDHLAASELHAAAEAGALRQEGDEWRVTPEGVAAMRIHFTGWHDQFEADAGKRGLE